MFSTAIKKGLHISNTSLLSLLPLSLWEANGEGLLALVLIAYLRELNQQECAGPEKPLLSIQQHISSVGCLFWLILSLLSLFWS